MRTVALIIFPLYGWLLFFSSTCLTWSKDLPALQEQRHRDGSNTSVLVHSSETGAASNGRPCELCDTYVIPYPLSTGPNCGEPMYCKFKCNATYGKVSFMMHGRECEVTNNIDAKARRFSIKVEGLNYCDPNYGREPLDFPFTVTNWCFGGKDSQEIEVTWQQLPPESPIQGGPTSAKHSTTRLLLVLVVTIASMVFLACAIIFAYVWRKKIAHKQDKRSVQRMQEGVYDSKRHGEGLIGLQEKDSERVEVPCFNFETILAATDNFSDANKLGRGGYGPVYKGRLAGGQDIAVKRLSSVSTQGLQEFKNEVVLIAKLQHRNLVRLQGYCIKDDEKILLYEYMPNKSLDSFLFDPTRAQLLDWQSRSEIILGVARGLLYLHQDSRLRVIHRDLKASNILLDEEMNPKISDFGLARIFRGKEIEANTNRIVGTYGYMAPEYALEGLFSLKSDVFSFGIVLLEIISGKKNTGFYQSQQASSLLAYAWRLWTENNLQDLIDPCLGETCNANQFMRYANVGLLCVQNEPNDRPTMSNVVIMLDSEIATLPTPKQPAFFSSKGFTGTVLSSSKPETNLKIESSYLEGR